MADRCLMAASLAVLVCHPSSTIICFKSQPSSPPTSPQKQRPQSPNPLSPLAKSPISYLKNAPFRSKKKQDDNQANANSNPQPPPRLILRNGEHFSEVVEGEASRGVVETIFRSGWNDQKVGSSSYTIEKILKVNHNADVLSKFEEYRQMVKSKADEIITGVSKGHRTNQRVLADGNELLRFYGTVITCPLSYMNGSVYSICNKECCSLCRVIGSRILIKKAGSPSSSFSSSSSSFSSSSSSSSSSSVLSDKSWRAHEKVTARRRFVSASAKNAIILCRVIAGRVACYHGNGLVDGEEGGFDSVVRSNRGSEDIIVFNLSAVLPCFVVIYDTTSVVAA